MSGHSAIDVRLTTELRGMVAKIASVLDLDGTDTNAKELYYALQSKARNDEKILAERMGITDEDSSLVVAKKIVAFIEKSTLPRDVWVIKPSVVKPLLKTNSPKKLMKIVGYRSIDSVLKRKTVGELLAFASLTETEEWLQKLHTKYKKLTPSDFSLQSSELHLADMKEVEKLRASGYLQHDLVLPNYELGNIVVVPATKRFSGDVLVLSTAILESLRSLRMHAAYYRALSVLPSFGKELTQILEHGLAKASRLLMNTDWTHVHALHGHHAVDHVLSSFQPNLQDEDLETHSAAKALASWIPEFSFWHSYPYAYQVASGGTVSSDLFDVAINLSNNVPYEQASSRFGEHNLSSELHARYLAHEPVAQQHLKWYDGRIA